MSPFLLIFFVAYLFPSLSFADRLTKERKSGLTKWDRRVMIVFWLACGLFSLLFAIGRWSAESFVDHEEKP